jgi:phytoene dehydrogenase-like protein
VSPRERRRGPDAGRPAAGPAVVIGGGVAGLATAALMAREGYEVTLLERREELGGRAGTLRAEGFTWDAGPSWYLMPEAFDHFYELMGTSTAEQLELISLDPAYRVYSGSREPVDVRSGTEEVARLFEGIEPGAGRAVREYLEDAGETYRTAVSAFLYSTFTRLGPYLAPGIAGQAPKLARLLARSLHAEVAARFSDGRLRQILTYPAVFLSSQPRRTPAMYGLMSHTDLVQGVRYPLGGFGTFVDSLRRLAEEAGVEIVTGAEVTAIGTEPLAGGVRGGMAGRDGAALRAGATGREAPAGRGGTASGDGAAVPGGVLRRSRRLFGRARRLLGRRARVTGVSWRDGEGAEKSLPAGVVVSAADLHHTETALLPPGLRTRPERTWRRRNPGIGTVLAYLGVAGELPQLAHHTMVFSEDWDPDFRAIFTRGDAAPGAFSESVYVCRPSASDPALAPEGCENLFLLIPVPARAGGIRGSVDGPGDAETERIVDAVIATIARRAGIPDLAGRVTVRRTAGPGDFEGRYHAWRGNALGLAHTLAQSAFLRGSNASRRVEGLLYAGSTTTPGVGLPMCLISAENVLKRLRGDVSVGPLPAGPLRGGRRG